MCSSLLSNYYNDSFHVEIPQEHYHTPSAFLIPSPIYIPLEDEAVFSEFFQQEPFFLNDHNHNILAHEMTTNTMIECFINNGQNATNHIDDDHGDVEPDNHTPMKRPSNRIRPCKINTARGPRDRRIRLSLDVAKRLFGLQDLLGFDKASKAIAWLLIKSETAILDLLPDRSCSFMGGVSNNASSSSEWEVVSTDTKAKSSSGSRIKHKDKSIGVRKCEPLAKETRVRARQRARKRTIEKQNMYKKSQDSTFSQGLDQVMDLDVNALGYWSISKEDQHLIIDQANSNFQFCQGSFVGDNSSFLPCG